jgi:membrane associated rhomboid family serine protease
MAYYHRPQFSIGGPLTPRVKFLIIVCGVGFLLLKVAENTAYGRLFYGIFGLIPYLFWNKFFVWQLVTYIFLHGGLFHLLFNLFALWIFGGEIERYMGSSRFIQYFFITAIGAGICTVLVTPGLRVPVVGASGGIYGLLLAYAWFFPERYIYVWFMFPMKAKHFVLLFGAIEFWSSLGGTGSGIAHLAHLGGILFGLLYFNYYRIGRWLRLTYLKFKYWGMGGDRKGSDDDKWDGWGRA